jgi:hypothetical protein
MGILQKHKETKGLKAHQGDLRSSGLLTVAGFAGGLAAHEKELPMRKCFSLAVLVMAAVLAAGAFEAQAGKPKIRILATGGTIAGTQAKPGESGFTAGIFSVANLIAAVPQLQEIAQVSGEQIANIGSQTMNDAVWLKPISSWPLGLNLYLPRAPVITGTGKCQVWRVEVFGTVISF